MVVYVFVVREENTVRVTTDIGIFKESKDVLACSITATVLGRRAASDLSTATKEASQRLYGARDAPLLWRSAPGHISRCGRIWRGRRGTSNRRSSRNWRFSGLVGADGWYRLRNGRDDGRSGRGWEAWKPAGTGGVVQVLSMLCRGRL